MPGTDWAAAVTRPVPGGMSTRELLSIMMALRGITVVGADVVEMAPLYDSPSNMTLAAAEVVITLLELMVRKPAGGWS